MKKYIGVIVIVLLICAGGATAAYHVGWLKLDNAVPTVAAVEDPTYTAGEVMAFRNMITVCHHMDSLDNFYMKGTMHGTGPSDSASAMQADFEFCRRGQTFYYRIGAQEMVSLPDMFIDIDRNLKKMEISAPKQVTMPSLMNADELLKVWEGEHYSVSRDSVAGRISIRLLCEQHASCKEYRFTYDPATQLAYGMFMRLTDINDPFNRSSDRTVSINVGEWTMHPLPALLDRMQYLSGGKGNWQPARRYTGFELSQYQN